MNTLAFNVVFRVDASLEIGTGHVMRCLTLADTLVEQGAACHFICRRLSGNLIDLIRQRKHKVYELPEPNANPKPDNRTRLAHEHWLQVAWQVDAAQTRDVLQQHQLHADWLVVDHYALDARWEKAVKPFFDKLFVIDDLADRDHIADLLLDQNLGRRDADYEGRVPEHSVRLIGPHYALLRPEFAELRPNSLKRREEPELKHILITMGGVDKDNVTGMVLDALRDIVLAADIQISIVLGPGAPWTEAVRRQVKDLSLPATVRVNVPNMAALMADADLVIGAAGSTSWERCCLGLPSIMVVLADNQRLVAEGLQDANAANVVWDVETIAQDLPALLRDFFESPENVRRMSKAAAKVTDGEGAARLTGYLE